MRTMKKSFQFTESFNRAMELARVAAAAFGALRLIAAALSTGASSKL